MRRSRTTVITTPVASLTFAAACAAAFFLPQYLPEWVVPASWPMIREGLWWCPLTSALLHANIGHLGSNMLALIGTARGVEPAIGRLRLAVILAVGAYVSGLAFAIMHMADGATVVGASGAVFALFGVQGAMMAKSPQARTALPSWLSLIAINLAWGFVAAGIAWESHVAGLVTGFLLGLAMTPPRQEGGRQRLDRS